MSATRRKKKSLLVDDFPFPIKKITLAEGQIQESVQIAPVAEISVESKVTPSSPAVEASSVSRPAHVPGSGFRPQSISITKSKPASYLNADSEHSGAALNEPVQHNSAFSDDEFWQAWSAFQNTLSDEDRVGFLNLNLPVRQSVTTFELVANNPMQENEAKRLLSNAVQFLRSKLNNSSVTILTRIAEETEVHRSKSPEELYMDMISRNPQLEQFRKLLNLEID